MWKPEVGKTYHADTKEEYEHSSTSKTAFG